MRIKSILTFLLEMVLKIKKALLLFFRLGKKKALWVQEVEKLGGKVFRSVLEKVGGNPILQPILEHSWESKLVFNPAAVYEAEKVHLVYRAVGDNDISVLGYASSKDGIHIDERLKKPIYVPKESFESNHQTPKVCFVAFMSGGGCGGCEDPKITKIGNRFYMTYVAWNGSNLPRVALTSISVDDFLDHRWHWEKPVLISPPGVIDKSCCLFPERIRGKYVILHRIFPNILMDFVDDLSFDGKTKWLKGDFAIKPRKASWDSHKISPGAPPIKTKDGWLLIYHAVGNQDSSRYKIGAMLLDLKDPTSILYRSNRPILQPSEWYENEGHKRGVVYPSGAVVFKNQLFVYYGGADTVVCAASAPLSQFLDQLKSSGTAELEPVMKQSRAFKYDN